MIRVTPWRGDEFLKKEEAELVKSLHKVGIHVKGRCKVKLNSAKSPPTAQPGEAPHRDSGHAMPSVAYEVDPSILTCRVGSNVIYLKYLELGWTDDYGNFHGPRPWLRSTAAEEGNAIEGIFKKQPPIKD